MPSWPDIAERIEDLRDGLSILENPIHLLESHHVCSK